MTGALSTFYVVTTTSIYCTEAVRPWVASAVKIALRGESALQMGEDLARGGMIAVGKWLQAYYPEKYGLAHPLTGFERRLEEVSTTYWGWGTSSIVALFKSEDEARICFGNISHVPCDPRWRKSTRSVLEEIGDDHPSFYVARSSCLSLFASEGANA